MQPGGTEYSLTPEEKEEKEETKAEGLEKPDPTKNSSRKRKKELVETDLCAFCSKAPGIWFLSCRL